MNEPIVEPLVIVKSSVYNRLLLKTKLFSIGWVLAVLVIAGNLALLNKFNTTVNKLDSIQHKQYEVELLQKQTTSSFVKAWDNQQQGINLIVSWADFIKQRDELSAYNRAPDKLPAYTATLVGSKRKNKDSN